MLVLQCIAKFLIVWFSLLVLLVRFDRLLFMFLSNWPGWRALLKPISWVCSWEEFLVLFVGEGRSLFCWFSTINFDSIICSIHSFFVLEFVLSGTLVCVVEKFREVLMVKPWRFWILASGCTRSFDWVNSSLVESLCCWEEIWFRRGWVMKIQKGWF